MARAEISNATVALNNFRVPWFHSDDELPLDLAVKPNFFKLVLSTCEIARTGALIFVYQTFFAATAPGCGPN